MCEINADAESLLEVDARECLSRPCYEVVGARDALGRSFCQENCPVRQGLSAGLGLVVHHLQRARSGGGFVSMHLFPIAVQGPTGHDPWLVHCVIDAGRCQRLHDYLARVASPLSVPPVSLSNTQELTARETEIIELLIEGLDLVGIGRDLHISYNTVRNHVQHILPKLSAHSIHQAIAVFLLRERTPAE